MSSAGIHHILHVVDGATEETLHVVEIVNFDLPQFARQFDVPTQTDPEMLDRYVVGPDDLDFLSQFIGTDIAFDFSSNGYWIEAVTG